MIFINFAFSKVKYNHIYFSCSFNWFSYLSS